MNIMKLTREMIGMARRHGLEIGKAWHGRIIHVWDTNGSSLCGRPTLVLQDRPGSSGLAGDTICQQCASRLEMLMEAT